MTKDLRPIGWMCFISVKHEATVWVATSHEAHSEAIRACEAFGVHYIIVPLYHTEELDAARSVGESTMGDHGMVRRYLAKKKDRKRGK